jgi:hypothetical protein
VVTYYSDLSVDAGGDSFTMANGTMVGQLKVIRLTVTGGGTAVITPTSLAGGTTLTLSAADSEAELMWNGSAWRAIKLIGSAIVA